MCHLKKKRKKEKTELKASYKSREQMQNNHIILTFIIAAERNVSRGQLTPSVNWEVLAQTSNKPI